MPSRFSAEIPVANSAMESQIRGKNVQEQEPFCRKTTPSGVFAGFTKG